MAMVSFHWLSQWNASHLAAAHQIARLLASKQFGGGLRVRKLTKTGRQSAAEGNSKRIYLLLIKGSRESRLSSRMSRAVETYHREIRPLKVGSQEIISSSS